MYKDLVDIDSTMPTFSIDFVLYTEIYNCISNQVICAMESSG